MYTPQHLKKWIKESDYGGEDLSNWYILIARTRDSDNLENSNFESIMDYLTKDNWEIIESMGEDINNILLASFGHWACGWIESLMIHEGNDAALIMGDWIKEQLDGSPVFNDDDYQEREFKDYMINCNEAVKGWLDSKEIPYNDELVSKIIRQGDYIGWECFSDFYPDDDEVQNAYNAVIHTKHCNICESDYLDFNGCNCQLKMF
jgi:hypothetical protein